MTFFLISKKKKKKKNSCMNHVTVVKTTQLVIHCHFTKLKIIQ